MISSVQVGLTEKVVKDLQDKSLEKRSNAARIVQNDIEECVAKNDLNSIQNMIDVVKNWKIWSVQGKWTRTTLQIDRNVDVRCRVRDTVTPSLCHHNTSHRQMKDLTKHLNAELCQKIILTHHVDTPSLLNFGTCITFSLDIFISEYKQLFKKMKGHEIQQLRFTAGTKLSSYQAGMLLSS